MGKGDVGYIHISLPYSFQDVPRTEHVTLHGAASRIAKVKEVEAKVKELLQNSLSESGGGLDEIHILLIPFEGPA